MKIFNKIPVFILIVLLLLSNCASKQETTKAPPPAATEPPVETQTQARAGLTPEQIRESVENFRRQLKEITVHGFPPFVDTLSNSQISFIANKAWPIISTVLDNLPPGYFIQITGHSNKHPERSVEYTQQLSDRRANNVMNHLIKKKGAQASGLSARGVSNSRPLDPSQPRAHRNRRVTFQLLSR